MNNYDELNGLMPLRGHSSVQGSGEMGADPFVLPGGDYDDANRERIEKIWNFELPKWPGDSVGVTIENAMLPEDNERKLMLYYMSGGNFLETMPDPDFVAEAEIEGNRNRIKEARSEWQIYVDLAKRVKPESGRIQFSTPWFMVIRMHSMRWV